jgi:hypothetical protein
MTPLTLELAASSEGTVLLGALALKQLLVRGQCTFFINKQGVIELANPVELALDAHPESYAIHVLSQEHQYTDDQLVAYLRGREARSNKGEVHE